MQINIENGKRFNEEPAIAAVSSGNDIVLVRLADGTGVKADIPGYEVCGKTSTAEIASEEGGYKKDVYNLGFCGFIDNSSSKLVCFVGANEVYGMRQTTKIFNDIMTNAVKQYNITTDEAK